MKTIPLLVISTICASQALAYNLPKQVVKAYECSQCTQLSHETLKDSWPIEMTALQGSPSNTQQSYSYRKKVSAKQLQKGVAITTSAPNAVIRITPLQDQSMPQLQLITANKKQYSLKEASSLHQENANFDDSLKTATHQSILQLKPELGFGVFSIKTDETSDSGNFLISVFDKYSPAFLEITSDAMHYQYGDKVTATISLKNDVTNYDTQDVNAFLLGPQKQVIPMQLTEISPNVFKAEAVITSESNDRGENWYVEADVTGDVSGVFIRRNGHAGFSYSIPSASLLTVEKTSSKPLAFSVKTEVASASRYALQSVLFRKNDTGEITPLETTQTALWLEPGIQEIQFTFDNIEQLEEDSLYLGYLRLLDYGQLKTVYQFNDPIKITLLGKSIAP